MADPFKITVNTLDPFYEAVLVNGDGSVADLTGASVQFHLLQGSTSKVDTPAQIINATEGVVRHVWATGDTDTLGIFLAYWVVTYVDSSVVTYPSDTVDLVQIVTGPNVPYSPQSACAPWTTVTAVRLACGGISAASGDPMYASDELLQTEISVATDLLYTLSGRQFSGECSAIVRPCGQPNCFNAIPRSGSWTGVGQYVADPSAYPPPSCGCRRLHKVDLGLWPVSNIVYVRVDGTFVDPTTYRLDENRYLVRLDGEDPWPRCQHLDRAATEDGTFEVMVEYGIAPPPSGVAAANIMACELTKAALGGDCAIPRRARTVNRQQISFTMIDTSALSEGLTGIYEVDLFITAYNPHQKHRGGAFVWSPDLDIGSWRTG